MTSELIEFVPSSWYYEDDIVNDKKESLIIYMFGRMGDGKSISVRVVNYKLSMSIRVPNEWTLQQYTRASQYLIDYFVKQNPGTKRSDIFVNAPAKHYDLYEHFCGNQLFTFMKFEFTTVKIYQLFHKIFYNRIKIPNVSSTFMKFDTYEQKLDPIMSFIIDLQLNACDWNTITNYTSLDPELTITDYYYQVTYNDVKAYTGESKPLPPFLILSYDIECISGDGSFPQPEKPTDKVVSICGTTNVYGSEKIVRTDVLALLSTGRIAGDNIHIKCFDNEKDLILAWKDTICEIDPDFIIGYNSMDFDNKYLKVKAEQPGIKCEDALSRMSRLKKHRCVFKSIPLSSAGLGDNLMHVYLIPGIEQLDVMKLIQQECPLTEYSLDKVCEQLMKNGILSITNEGTHYHVKTKSDGVVKGNYVKFEIFGFVEQEKYQVYESFETVVDGNTIYNLLIHKKSKNEVDEDEGEEDDEDTVGNICKATALCLAKDDMGPQELFESFPKGPMYRRKIHQYCIQDCALVNKLCHRLDFITQRMALGNIAGVPFNYIIMRGQGIKTLALFTKYCRLKNYIIKDRKPVKKDNDEKVGYEGAIVLKPIRGFYTRPLTTLDFNSLYPSCEMAMDMSHENMVVDENYMNLPGYHYRTIEYEEKINKVGTGKMIKVVFATLQTNVDERGNQIDGKYGIAGSILDNLLKNRKIAKKKMETDPTRKKIHDNQQKALKVTANSIYGQLGSEVSMVGCPPIAAATTAVGRMLLKRGEHHSNTRFKKIVVGLYNSWVTGNDQRVNDIYRIY